jgi:hypothetical protein
LQVINYSNENTSSLSVSANEIVPSPTVPPRTLSRTLMGSFTSTSKKKKKARCNRRDDIIEEA